MSEPGQQPEARRSSRRRSREQAVQGLYQWQLTGDGADAIEKQLSHQRDFDKADERFFLELLRGVLARAGELDEALGPCLDRSAAGLSPVEHAVLLIGAFELSQRARLGAGRCPPAPRAPATASAAPGSSQPARTTNVPIDKFRRMAVALLIML